MGLHLQKIVKSFTWTRFISYKGWAFLNLQITENFYITNIWLQPPNKRMKMGLLLWNKQVGQHIIFFDDVFDKLA